MLSLKAAGSTLWNRRLSGCQKTHGELERAEALSNKKSSPAACTVGAGLFYRREIPFPGEKIASLQVLRPEPEGFKQNLRGGGSGGGACSPVHQLVKKTFLTSWSLRWFSQAQTVKKPCGEFERATALSFSIIFSDVCDENVLHVPLRPEISQDFRRRGAFRQKTILLGNLESAMGFAGFFVALSVCLPMRARQSWLFPA